jgi:hypothetical protein
MSRFASAVWRGLGGKSTTKLNAHGFAGLRPILAEGFLVFAAS